MVAGDRASSGREAVLMSGLCAGVCVCVCVCVCVSPEPVHTPRAPGAYLYL